MQQNYPAQNSHCKLTFQSDFSGSNSSPSQNKEKGRVGQHEEDNPIPERWFHSIGISSMPRQQLQSKTKYSLMFCSEFKDRIKQGEILLPGIFLFLFFSCTSEDFCSTQIPYSNSLPHVLRPNKYKNLE